METINTDVIIIGAGPTGLSLACQFIRYGIDFVVVEKGKTMEARRAARNDFSRRRPTFRCDRDPNGDLRR